jgi:hypothetical protein
VSQGETSVSQGETSVSQGETSVSQGETCVPQLESGDTREAGFGFRARLTDHPLRA